MICAVHQPNFVPYLGFFDKLYACDVFVLYDTAQYSKGEFHNRNRILGPKGPEWLTIPVAAHLEPMKCIRLSSTQPFVDAHVRKLEQAYGTTPGGEATIAMLAEAYSANTSGLLVDLNVDILERIMTLLGDGPRLLLASDLGLDPALRATDALLAIVTAVGAGTYLSGAGARNYLEADKFADAGLDLQWQDFHHPVYPQGKADEFIPNLSVLDPLCHIGADALSALIARPNRPESS